MSVRRRLVEELARCRRHAGGVALAMLAFAAACDPVLPAATFVIDPTIDVPVGELPGFEDGAPRPIAVVTGDDGAAAMFVEDEVWLQTDDKSELDAFLERWRGTVLSTFDPAEAGLAGLPKHYLIRIDASAADTKKLPDSLSGSTAAAA